MSQIAVEQFLGRVLTDPEFVDQVLANGQTAAFKQGFFFADKEWEALKVMNLKKLTLLSPVINERLKRGQNRVDSRR